MKHKIPRFSTTEVEKAEAKFQPLHKLFQAPESNKNLEKRTEHLCKTCRDREFSDEHGDGTCCQNWEGSRTENSDSCCEVCGKLEDSCLGCCNVYREVQCKSRCPYCRYITTEVKETEVEIQPIDKLLRAPQHEMSVHPRMQLVLQFPKFMTLRKNQSWSCKRKLRLHLR